MIEAVENHMPEVIVIDEIGSEAEALAAATIAQRGVQLVATAHGEHLENILNNPTLQSLLGGVGRSDSPLSLRGLAFLLFMRSVYMPSLAVGALTSALTSVVPLESYLMQLRGV